MKIVYGTHAKYKFNTHYTYSECFCCCMVVVSVFFSPSSSCVFLFGYSHCHFVCHPFGCMQIRLKYMEMAFCDKDSATPHVLCVSIAKCGSPINFLYDYYGCARMGKQIIANGSTIH